MSNVHLKSLSQFNSSLHVGTTPHSTRCSHSVAHLIVESPSFFCTNTQELLTKTDVLCCL